MDYLLQAKVFLRKFGREGLQDHFQDVLGTLILIRSVPVLVPYLSDELAEYFALQITYLLAYLNPLDHRPTPSPIYYRMN